MPDLKKYPEPPDLSSQFAVPNLQGTFDIGGPCIGIGGWTAVWKAVGMERRYTWQYDLDERYRDCLRRQLGADCFISLGEKDGDILKVNMNELAGVDIIATGPPCPPWAGNGNRKGCKDPRADVFATVLRWIVHLASLGDKKKLKIALVENVAGCMKTCDGKMPYMACAKEALEKEVQHFVWDIVYLQVKDYSLPHNHVRCILRGMNRIIGDRIPDPLPGFGTADLRSFLRHDLPATDRKTLIPNKLQNLRDLEFKVKCKVRCNDFTCDDIVVFSIDRADEKAWKQSMFVNCIPTLTCTNGWLWVCSAGDIWESPEDREFSRFLDPIERFALQGMSPTLAATLPCSEVILKATGNAYPPQIIGAACVPILRMMAEKGIGAGEPIAGCAPGPRTKTFKVVQAQAKGKAKAKGKGKAMKVKTKAKPKRRR